MEVVTANVEDKIMTATSSKKDLKPSISFGKFESDVLSWEKFSSFSPNKYLEEVEKCATPGSVAQKKAYFESHYKKIAERKVGIILEEEKHLERNTNNENDGLMIIGSNGESSSKEDRRVISIAADVDETCIHEPLGKTINFEKCESSANMHTVKLEKLEEVVHVEEKTELIIQVEGREKPEEVVCIEEDDISSKDRSEMKEKRKEKNRNLVKKTDKNVQTKDTRDSPKVVPSRKTQPSKEKSMTKATKKAASPVSKASGYSTPRMSKPALTVKKEDVSRNKQIASKTLHSSATALSTARKSLIMERMGDKDIVRRAFKTFRNQVKPSGDGQEDTTPTQVPAKATSVSRIATSSQKENGRLAKSDGTERKSINSRLSSSFVPKSNRTAEKQENQLTKPRARAVEKILLKAKPKADATNAKTRRQSLDPKAKSMQGPLVKGSSVSFQ